MAYNTYIQQGFYDIAGNLWGLLIERKDYTGAPLAVGKMSSPPLVFDYGESTQFPHSAPIQDTRLSFGLESNGLLQLAGLFDHDPKKHRVTVTFKGNAFFVGYLVGDTYDEPYRTGKFFVDFAANDALKLLDARKWLNSGTYTEFSIMRQCLYETGLNLDINIAISTELYDPAGTTPPPYERVYKPCADYVADDLTYLDVLKDILLSYGAVIKQVGGEWQIIQYNEQAKGSYTSRKYDYSGTFLSESTISPAIEASGNGVNNNLALLTSSRLNINPAFKNLVINRKLTAGDSWVKNYDFNEYNQVLLNSMMIGAKYWDSTNTVRIVKSLRQVGVQFAFLQGGTTDNEPDASTGFMHQQIGHLSGLYRAPGTDYYVVNFSMLFGLMNESGNALSGDVYIKMRLDNNYLKIHTDGYGYFANGESYIKIGSKNANSINAPVLDLFELEIRIHPNDNGMLDLWLYEPVNCSGAVGELGSGAIFDKVILHTDEHIESEQKITTSINTLSNYEPDELEIYAADLPEVPFGELAYLGFLQLADGTPTKQWTYTTFDTLEVIENKMKVLAAQVERLFKLPQLTFNANITSDIMRFNSLVKDPPRLGSTTFAIHRARFEPKRLAWSGVEMLALNGEIVPDFDSDDFDNTDFFTD